MTDIDEIRARDNAAECAEPACHQAAADRRALLALYDGIGGALLYEHHGEEIRAAKVAAWQEGYQIGHSRAMRAMSDEPQVVSATNPYLKVEMR